MPQHTDDLRSIFYCLIAQWNSRWRRSTLKKGLSSPSRPKSQWPRSRPPSRISSGERTAGCTFVWMPTRSILECGRSRRRHPTPCRKPPRPLASFYEILLLPQCDPPSFWPSASPAKPQNERDRLDRKIPHARYDDAVPCPAPSCTHCPLPTDHSLPTMESHRSACRGWPLDCMQAN
jgi:hypothetical protein